MQARIRTTNKIIEGRTFQFCKLPVLDGLKLGKTLAAKLFPLLQSFMSKDEIRQKKQFKDLVKDVSPNALDKVQMDSVAKVLESISPEDLEMTVRMALTRVYEILPGNSCQVMDENGAYQVEDVEYDPVLFVQLVWEELKFGLSDFFDGSRWHSLFPAEEAAAEA